MKKVFLLFSVIVSSSFLYGQNFEVIEEVSWNHDTLSVIIQEEPQQPDDLIDVAVDPECIELCCSSGCSDESFILFGAGFAFIYEENKDYITDKIEEEVFYIQHIDFGMKYAVNNEIYSPYIRMQSGFLSTRFRVSYHTPQIDFLDAQEYRTYDWQILGIHIISIKELSLSISSGIMWQHYGDDYEPFHEHTAALDIYPIPRLSLRGEGRFAHGASAYSGIVRRELNGTFAYQLNTNEDIQINLLVGGTYAQYFQEEELLSLNMGLGMRFQ